MERRKFTVPNISCGHCVMSIKNELGDFDGIKKVDGDPERKEITVEWDSPATLEKIKAALQEMNFPASE